MTTKTKQIRVYRYWAEPASRHDADLIDSQIRLAWGYRRALCNVENVERDAKQAVDLAEPEIRWRQERLNEIMRLPPETRVAAEVTSLKTTLQDLRRQRARDPEVQAQLTTIHTVGRQAVRDARGAASLAGLYWGTYLLVEDAHDRAVRTVDIWERLRPSPWSSIGVQIQSTRPLSTDQVIGGADTRLRIGADLYALGLRSEGYRPAGSTGAKNKGGHVRPEKLRRFEIRVGSEGRAPIWCALHVLLHRPLPENATVTWARVHRERHGIRLRYWVQIVVETAAPAPVVCDATRSVGIDVGWRRLENGDVRVAFACGEGWESQLVIPGHVVEGRRKPAELQSIRSQHQNAIAAALGEWRLTLPQDSPLRIETEHLHVWRKTGRFVRFHRLWSTLRVEGDAELFERVTRWLDNDRHLCDWQHFAIRNLGNAVKSRQEEWAAHIVARASLIGIEASVGIAAMRRRKAEEHHSSILVQSVSPAALLLRVANAAARSGVPVVKVPAPGTTFLHATCGTTMTVGHQLMAQCPTCGVEEDQDRNAARNIRSLASNMMRGTSGEPLAATRSRGKAPWGARRTRRATPTSQPLAGSAVTEADHS